MFVCFMHVWSRALDRLLGQVFTASPYRVTVRCIRTRLAGFLVLCMYADPEGPSSQYLRLLAPNTISLMAFGTRGLKYWIRGPFECRAQVPLRVWFWKRSQILGTWTLWDNFQAGQRDAGSAHGAHGASPILAAAVPLCGHALRRCFQLRGGGWHWLGPCEPWSELLRSSLVAPEYRPYTFSI